MAVASTSLRPSRAGRIRGALILDPHRAEKRVEGHIARKPHPGSRAATPPDLALAGQEQRGSRPRSRPAPSAPGRPPHPRAAGPWRRGDRGAASRPERPALPRSAAAHRRAAPRPARRRVSPTSPAACRSGRSACRTSQASARPRFGVERAFVELVEDQPARRPEGRGHLAASGSGCPRSPPRSGSRATPRCRRGCGSRRSRPRPRPITLGHALGGRARAASRRGFQHSRCAPRPDPERRRHAGGLACAGRRLPARRGRGWPARASAPAGCRRWEGAPRPGQSRLTIRIGPNRDAGLDPPSTRKPRCGPRSAPTKGKFAPLGHVGGRKARDSVCSDRYRVRWSVPVARRKRDLRPTGAIIDRQGPAAGGIAAPHHAPQRRQRIGPCLRPPRAQRPRGQAGGVWLTITRPAVHKAHLDGGGAAAGVQILRVAARHGHAALHLPLGLASGTAPARRRRRARSPARDPQAQ